MGDDWWCWPFCGDEQGKIEYSQSKEQKKLMELMMPVYERMSAQATGGAPAYQIPEPWQIPATSSMLPTRSLYASLDPSISAGLWYPYEQGADRLINRMAGMGTLGVPGAGMSGAGAAGLGRYFQGAASDVATQLGGLVSGAAQQQWGAQLGQNQEMWRQQLAQQLMPYQMFPGSMGATMPQTVAWPASNAMGQLGQMMGGAGALMLPFMI